MNYIFIITSINELVFSFYLAGGCQKIFAQPPNRVMELFKGSVLQFSCELGYSFEGSFTSYRIYCDGSRWRSIKSTGDYWSLTHINRYLLVKS